MSEGSKVEFANLDLYYGQFHALKGVCMKVLAVVFWVLGVVMVVAMNTAGSRLGGLIQSPPANF